MSLKTDLQREANILRNKIQVSEAELVRNKKHLKRLSDKILQLNLREPVNGSVGSEFNSDDLTDAIEEQGGMA